MILYIIILQVQAWASSWWSENLHIRRWDFLDIISPGQGDRNKNTDKFQRKKGVCYLPLFNTVCLFFQIHAYNLETNYWDEIVTKPHEKIGLWAMRRPPLLVIIWSCSIQLTLPCLWQVTLLPEGVTAVCRSKMVRCFELYSIMFGLRGLKWLTHQLFFLPKEVFICGGYNGEVILSDLWKINLQTFQWTKLPAVMPEPAYFHCAAVTPVS